MRRSSLPARIQCQPGSGTGACAAERRQLRRALAGRRGRGQRSARARHAPQSRPDLSPTPNIATIWSATTTARRSTRRFACCRADPLQRAEAGGHRRVRLDAADRRYGLTGLFYVDARATERLQYRLGPVPAKGAGRLRHRQRAASAFAGPTSAGRSSSGRRTCSTRIMRRSRSTRRSRRRAASPVHDAPFVDPQYPGGRQIFSPSSPSRGPTASRCGPLRRLPRRAGLCPRRRRAAAAAGDADLRRRQRDRGRCSVPGVRRRHAPPPAPAPERG